MNVKIVLSRCTHFDKCFPAHSPCCEYVNNIWGVIDECRPVSCTAAPARRQFTFRYRICLVALPQLGGKFWIKLRCCGFKISLQKCWGESWVSSGGWRPGNCAVSPWQLVPGPHSSGSSSNRARNVDTCQLTSLWPRWPLQYTSLRLSWPGQQAGPMFMRELQKCKVPLASVFSLLVCYLLI